MAANPEPSVESTTLSVPDVGPSKPERTSSMSRRRASAQHKKREFPNGDEPRRPSGSNQAPVKHVKRRTSQPILTWLQRKIGGNKQTTKKRTAKELSNATNSPDIVPLKPTMSHTGSQTRTTEDMAPTLQRRPSSLRIVIRPSGDLHSSTGGLGNHPRSTHSSAHSGSVPEYAWSTRDHLGADDDASIRPLPPTSPPSPRPISVYP